MREGTGQSPCRPLVQAAVSSLQAELLPLQCNHCRLQKPQIWNPSLGVLVKMKKSLLCLTTILLLSKCVRSYDQKSVAITDLVVPKSPRTGEDVSLVCHYRLAGYNHRLYTVNWWRGKDQFYTYKGTEYDQKHAFNFPGIQVNMEASTDELVVLSNVSEETSGLFKCEVMGEGPSFRTAVQTKSMTVIVPPRQVEIHSWEHRTPATYRAGETVHLNCTARGAKPRPHLVWEINGREVRELDVLRFSDFEDQRGRVTSTVGLRWMAPEYFEGNVARVVCEAVVGGHSTSDSRDIYLDPASSAAFNHQYASGGCQLSTTWTILSLASFLIARTFP